MARSRAEIEADMERLNAELAETVDDMEEVLDEAVEATEDAIEDAVEEAVEEVEEAIEDAADDAAEDAPLVEDSDDAAPAIAAAVISHLEEKYELTPRTVVEHTEHHITETVEEDEAPVETAPHSEHWSRRRIW